MTRKREIIKSGFLLVAFSVLLVGCYPDKIDYVEEYDVAATLFDEEVDFSQYVDFTVLDTIMHMTEDGDDDPNFTREHDEFILELIRENMLNNGYEDKDEPSEEDRPDLLIFVQAISSEYYQYWGGWWGYWGWYPGWDYWYPGYPWYPSYPWYPGYVTSYTTGTLMVEIMDAESIDPEEKSADVLWVGLIDGLLSNNKQNSKKRLETQINQLFIQSEYLMK